MPRSLPTAGDRLLDIGVYGARGIPSTYSGFETFLTSVLPRLAQRGHAVTMYCRRGEVPPAAEHRGVTLRHTRAIATKSASTLTHGLTAGLAARRAGHDVVLVVNLANVPYCAAGRLSGQPVVLNTDGQEWLRGKWGPGARWYFRTSARLAGRSATALVSDCLAMRELYRGEFGADSTVIPYGYDPPGPPDPALLAPFGLSPGGYLLVGGRLVPENNIERIVRRHTGGPGPLPIAVLGAANYDSPVVAALRRLAADDPRVRLVGHVGDRATYLALLAGAARYLHGHSVGGINPSLVEAMGAGARIAALATPFNAEALGTGAELFGDLGAGLDPFLVAPDDPGDDAVRREAGRARAALEYRVEDVVGAYEVLLRAAAAGPARRRVTVATRWGA